MTYNPDKHHRRSIRLQGYDYSQSGAYFVTICTFQRECLFGEIADETIRLGNYGAVVQTCWDDLPNHYSNVESDLFVVMPNHVHGIIVLSDTTPDARAGLRPAPTVSTPSKRHGLPEIMRAFKSFSTRRVNEARGVAGAPLWQRNYHEHIIRNEKSLNSIREYIIANPAQWAVDRENPANIKT